MEAGHGLQFWLNTLGASMEAGAALLGGAKWLLSETSMGKQLDVKLGGSWSLLIKRRETLIGWIVFLGFLVVWWVWSPLDRWSDYLSVSGGLLLLLAGVLGGAYALLTEVSKLSTVVAVLFPVFAAGVLMQAVAAWMSY